MHKLRYNKEAIARKEALPMGNGRLGDMVFSNSINDRIRINEDTLWTGNPGKETKTHYRRNFSNT